MFKRILIAFDGSEPAKIAYNTALKMAKNNKSELFVISVANLPEPPVDVESEAFLEKEMEYYQKTMSHLKAAATLQGVKAHFEVLVGRAAQTIVKFADENKINLIITGSVKEKGIIERWVLGSVSKQILDYAQCSVMIIRQ